MADPVSIAGLSLQVAQILGPAVLALIKARREGKNIHNTLRELESDLKAIYELVDNIQSLLSMKSFADAVRSVPDIKLIESLESALQRCLSSADKLSNMLFDQGLDIDAGRIKRTWRAWRLDRRLSDIDRQKRNFQDYKSSIQLAFQLLTTWKQMQIAEQGDQHASDLKAQISELQRAIDSIAQQITIRQIASSDEEQTKILDGMKDIRDTSRTLQRRATEQLEYLTSQTSLSQTKLDKAQLQTTHQESMFPPLEEEDYRKDSISSSLPIPPGLDPSTSSKDLYVGPRSPLSTLSGSQHFTPGSDREVNAVLSVLEFETRINALLSSAGTYQMGKSKPFSEDVISQLSTMLNAVGKPTWGDRPRTYLVLRLLGEVKAMDLFIFEGYKDIDFPYTEATLPDVLGSANCRRQFLHQQRYVLSPQSTDLFKGGRHRHLEHSGDTFFKVMGKLGSGGFSVVDRVHSKFTLQEYARKRILRSGAFAKDRKALLSFENEVHNLKRLSHHHLVQFVGSYTDRKYIGIIMQPVADMNLRQYLLRTDLTAEDLIILRSFLGCLCSALTYLHEQQCRHKDIKPQNILIHGETVLLADFGTALHWTDPESEVTGGLPEAYTKFYVAPEVLGHAPRDKSSDIWSLGCVFLEIATVLAGLTLQDKTKFFVSLQRPSAAYSLNHDGIQTWLEKLDYVFGNNNIPLHAWIASMTAIEPSLRPTANDIVNLISQQQTDGSVYGRACCFDETTPSENTSWEGSVAGKDIFETAQTISDATTTTSKAMPDPILPIIEPTSEIQIEQIHNEATMPLKSKRSSVAKPDVGLEDWNNLPISFLKLDVQSAPLDINDRIEQWEHQRAAMIISESKDIDTQYPTLADVMGKTEQLPKAEDTTERILPILSCTADLENDHEIKSEIFKDLKASFLRSHQRFEEQLLQLKRKDPDWKSYVLSMIDESLVDHKKFTILLCASNFSNVALAEDVVKIVVKRNPRTIHETTIFQNSALHYAAWKDRPNIAKLLIENGISPGQQNIRGCTALHLALMTKSRRTASMLISHLSAAELSIMDDRGLTPMHQACISGISTEIIRYLFTSGAAIDLPDRYGLSPIQRAIICRHKELTTVLKEEIMKKNPEYQITQVDWNSAQSIVKEKDLDMCWCRCCSLRAAVQKTGHRSTNSRSCCTCYNHMRVFARDCLNRFSLRSLERCPCNGCRDVRNDHKTKPSCGTPIGNDYSPYPYNLEPKFDRRSQAQIPRARLDNKSTLVYNGHEYYDLGIEKAIEGASRTGSQEQRTGIARNELKAVGFKSPGISLNQDVSNIVKRIISGLSSFQHLDTTVGILLESGADVNTTNYDDANLISKACGTNNLLLLKLLLDHKADITFGNILDSMTRDGSHDFKIYGRVFEIFQPEGYKGLETRMLLRAGAPIDAQSIEEKWTALHFATQLQYNNWAVPMLLGHGALPSIQDNQGNTPLHLAVAKKQLAVAVALLVSGAKREVINNEQATPLRLALDTGDQELISVMFLHGVNVNKKLVKFECVLFYAIHKNLGKIVRLLLEEYDGTSQIQNKTSSMNSTIWHVLAASSMQDEKVINIISRYKVDVSKKNKRGLTALHYAAWKGNIVVAKKLLQLGAPLDTLTSRGETALRLAESNCHGEIVKCLGGTYRKGSWWRKTRKQFYTTSDRTPDSSPF